nr:Alpha/Beta hydrolase fold [Ipomoea batatas]
MAMVAGSSDVGAESLESLAASFASLARTRRGGLCLSFTSIWRILESSESVQLWLSNTVYRLLYGTSLDSPDLLMYWNKRLVGAKPASCISFGGGSIGPSEMNIPAESSPRSYGFPLPFETGTVEDPKAFITSSLLCITCKEPAMQFGIQISHTELHRLPDVQSQLQLAQAPEKNKSQKHSQKPSGSFSADEEGRVVEERGSKNGTSNSIQQCSKVIDKIKEGGLLGLWWLIRQTISSVIERNGSVTGFGHRKHLVAPGVPNLREAMNLQCSSESRFLIQSSIGGQFWHRDDQSQLQLAQAPENKSQKLQDMMWGLSHVQTYCYDLCLRAVKHLVLRWHSIQQSSNVIDKIKEGGLLRLGWLIRQSIPSVIDRNGSVTGFGHRKHLVAPGVPNLREAMVGIKKVEDQLIHLLRQLLLKKMATFSDWYFTSGEEDVDVLQNGFGIETTKVSFSSPRLLKTNLRSCSFSVNVAARAIMNGTSNVTHPTTLSSWRSNVIDKIKDGSLLRLGWLIRQAKPSVIERNGSVTGFGHRNHLEAPGVPNLREAMNGEGIKECRKVTDEVGDSGLLGFGRLIGQPVSSVIGGNGPESGIGDGEHLVAPRVPYLREAMQEHHHSIRPASDLRYMDL